MFNCDCEELIKKGETIQDAELRINKEIMKKEQMKKEIEKKEVLTQRDIELRDTVLPAEIGCLKVCRENLQKKWFMSQK